MRVTYVDARRYYLKEAAENSWTVSTLDRNISTLYYQRLLSSQIKERVINEMLAKAKTAYVEKKVTENFRSAGILSAFRELSKTY